MDFSIEQHEETRFMYVTIFKKLLSLSIHFLVEINNDNSEYEKEIKKYLKNEGIEISRFWKRRKGVIPMTCYPFFNENTDHFIKIGTSGDGQSLVLAIQ